MIVGFVACVVIKTASESRRCHANKSFVCHTTHHLLVFISHRINSLGEILDGGGGGKLVGEIFWGSYS